MKGKMHAIDTTISDTDTDWPGSNCQMDINWCPSFTFKRNNIAAMIKERGIACVGKTVSGEKPISTFEKWISLFLSCVSRWEW